MSKEPPKLKPWEHYAVCSQCGAETRTILRNSRKLARDVLCAQCHEENELMDKAYADDF
jgi:hypothetical protein